MGILLSMGNVYAGLKIGFTTDGSLVAAIVAVVLLRSIGKIIPSSFSPHHTNLVQTTASAGAFCAVAGLTNAVPAMMLDGVNINPLKLIPWVFFVALLGVCISASLRYGAIEAQNLRFPSGVVCAETIKIFHAGGNEARKGAIALGCSAGFASIITWLRDTAIQIIPSKTTLPGKIGAFSMEKLSLGIAWSPLLLAIGGIIGLRTAISLFIGSILGWVIGGPLLAFYGLINPEAKRAIISWTIWPSIGLITAGGLIPILFDMSMYKRAFQIFKREKNDTFISNSPEQQKSIPLTWWGGGILFGIIGCAITAWIAFSVPVWQSLIAIILSFPIAIVAIRAVGETDMSPSNNLAKIVQFVFAAIAPGKTVPNVAAAGIASGCAIEASEVMTDYKAGAILKNKPYHQFLAQVSGILIASGAAVAAFTVLSASIQIGSESFPAPTAIAWHALATGLAGGKESIPQGASMGAWLAVCAGAILGVVSKKWKFIPFPSPVAIGLGMIFPACYSITILSGAIFAKIVSRLSQNWWEQYQYLLTSGLIVGESLTGILVAFTSIILGHQ